MLRSVVQIGTARRATINGYSVCGKTGTSEKYDAAARGWSDRKKFLSFFRA
jgi:cell division protein FtsI/penicillin-binding protein 2